MLFNFIMICNAIDLVCYLFRNWIAGQTESERASESRKHFSQWIKQSSIF